MTFLLLQTFLLLLAAYFAGAFTACLAKRWMAAGEERRLVPVEAVPRSQPQPQPQPHAPPPMQAPLSPTAAAAAAAARTAQLRPSAVAPPPRPAPAPRPRIEIKPRSIELVQPKIDLLPRPAPRPIPSVADTSRFERALTGPDPNEGMPRVPIQQILPAVFAWVTGPPGPWPPPEKPKPPPPPEPEAAPEPISKAATPPKSEPAKAPVVKKTPPSAEAVNEIRQKSGVSAAAANAAAAASAALAAAKAAAASIGSSRGGKPIVAEKPAASLSETKPGETKVSTPPGADSVPVVAKQASEPPKPAPSGAPLVTEGDDLQRIRAIDAATEQALKRKGVTRFETMARWTPDDIERLDDEVKLAGRIDGEQWVEQAQILAKGGETYYSRNRAAAARAAAASATASPPPVAAGPPAAKQESPPSASAPAATATAAAPVSAASDAEPKRPGQGRSVSEIAAAAAAAIAAASASVTRGIRPIEPTSPLSKADPNVVMPTKLTDAIREKEAKDVDAGQQRTEAPSRPAMSGDDDEDVGDDLKRIRGVGVLIEKRLKTLGVTTYDALANWTNEDIDRVSQTLDFKGRIEREGWVEQARILSSGGDTEFSRRVDRGEVDKDG